MTDIQNYELEQKLDREYEEWVTKQLIIIPELASRVFALRSKPYTGCGVHYAMEKRLGDVISRLNNCEYTPQETLMFRICTEVILTALLKSVAEAEASVKEHIEKE